LVVEATNDIDLTEEKALFTTQFKAKRQNCGMMGHKATDCKIDMSNSKGLRLK
jgi:hypothetical protein